MNIHISLSPVAGNPIFWYKDDQARPDAFRLPGDIWRLSRIDLAPAAAQLRDLLERASSGNYLDPRIHAKEISARFEELQPEFLRIERDFELQNTPTFGIPEPFREALGITDEVMPVEEWVYRYPAGATS